MLLSCAQLAALLMFALCLWMLRELEFLAPYRAVLVHQYLVNVLLFLVVLYLNLVALFYGVVRAIGLGHTGRRLRHVDRQLRTHRETVNPGLTDQLLR
jgi:hypothetical protein